MPAIPPHDSAVVDEPWDSQAQIDKLKEPMTKAVAQHEYAWYDGSAPDTDGDDGWPDAKSAYKFPHHEVSDQGKPGAANIPGCRNGLARLSNSDIPEADEQGVRDHLQHHLDAQPKPAAQASGDDDTLAHAGYEDAPDMPSRPGRVEHVLGRAWGIVPEVLVDLASRTAVVADGEMAARSSRPSAQMRATAQGGALAVIPLCGVITPRGSLLARLFGYSAGLEGFRESFREALADDNVSAILIDVDSPGGLIDLVPETAAEVFAARGTKPIVASCNTMCASAAYWIACQADELVMTPSGQVGSIGVFTVHEDVSALEARIGVKTTIISAGRFKTEGNPYEPLSKQGLAAMQSNVDDLYGMFTSDIARARSVPVQAVQAGYGEGRVLLAGSALALKVVDRVETFEQTAMRLGASAQDDPCEPDDDDLTPDDGEDDGDLEAQAAAGGSPNAAAADYLSSGRTRPAWQIGASRPSVGGRL